MKLFRTAAIGLISATCMGLASAPVMASSHREAPLVASEPQIDVTDVYAFVSPDKPDTVTLISNWIPLQEPSGGPTFFPWATDVRYNVHIDNNHDAKPDITYRWTFKKSYKNPDTFLYNTGPVNSLKDATLNFTQTYTLERISGTETKTLLTDAPVAPDRVGDASMPNYAKLRDEAIVPIGSSGRSFVGQADDPFFLDLRVFDLLYGANLKEAGNDTLDGYNVSVLALQVPQGELAAGGDASANPIIGVWSTAERQSMKVTNADGTQATSGDYVQVSRLGMPLVNEVVVPAGKKDYFNASKPEGDGQFLAKVTDPEVPKLIEAVYGIKAPATPRNDLVSVFLTGVEGLTKPANVTPSEQLRLNLSIAPVAIGDRLGVLGGDKAGFPNGRRLSDDVIDVALQVVEGELAGSPNDLGDGVNTNDVAFGTTFPYVALPHSGSAVRSQAAAPNPGGSTPQGGVAAGAGGTAPDGTPVLPAAALAAGVGLTLWGVRSRRATA